MPNIIARVLALSICLHSHFSKALNSPMTMNWRPHPLPSVKLPAIIGRPTGSNPELEDFSFSTRITTCHETPRVRSSNCVIVFRLNAFTLSSLNGDNDRTHPVIERFSNNEQIDFASCSSSDKLYSYPIVLFRLLINHATIHRVRVPTISKRCFVFLTYSIRLAHMYGILDHHPCSTG